MSQTNEIVTCVDCNNEFEITPGWRKLMEENPEIQPPKRCYDCRRKRKAEKNRDQGRERW